MKKRILLSILLSGFLLSCASKKYTAEEIKKESERLNAFFETSFQKTLEMSPTFETYVGGKRNYDKLDDISEEMEKKQLAKTKKELEQLKTFNYDALDEATKVSYQIFKYLGEREVRNFEFRYHDYPLNQMFGAQSELPSFMINMHRVENEADAKAYVSRLNGFKKFFAQTLEGLKKREQMGVIAPKFVYDKVIRDSENIVSGKPFSKKGKDSAIWADFQTKVKKLKLTKAKEATLLKEAKMALLDSVKPGFEMIISYMKNLEKKAPAQGGATRLPNGEAYYKNRLMHHTSTNMSAEKIHEIGLAEVARIHSEMKKIMKKVNFKSDRLSDFFEFMKTSKKFQYENNEKGRQAYLKKSEDIIATMNSRLGELFNVRPKSDITVKPVEAYREKSAGLAFYQGPSKDGKRPGIFYVNLYDMKQANAYELEALAYHEGIPGHHMQVAISTELKNVPDFRKYTWMTAYGEGWALYSELIPKEIGLYQDPYSDFGRLAMELWRAMRLVVDTGLHAKGWTREQAIDYVVEITPSTKEGAAKAVERYLVMPGQATAYKVGMLKILELRKASKEKLGTRFDIRGFHDEILKDGAMPLSLLEAKVDLWAQDQMKTKKN